MTETRTVRVMLVEDHADFRRLLASVVDREVDLEVVAQAGSLEEARGRMEPAGCDVAVLDMGLPDGVGSDLVAGLREACPGSAVLILSASLDASNRARAKEAGADGVLDKFGDPAEVVEEIRRLGAG
ncbi:MAG TPA: response regulator transcription factor [Rubrobacter sp.]|nr:response regulator transcription factor [Rubrobacter sp.]